MIRDKLRSETALAAFPSLRGSDGIGKTARKRGIFWPRKVHLIGSQRDVGGPDVRSGAYNAVSRSVRSLASLRPEPVYKPRPWISHDATISQGAAPHNPMDSIASPSECKHASCHDVVGYKKPPQRIIGSGEANVADGIIPVEQPMA